MSGIEAQRWAAFTDDPAGGNPAGVVLHAEGLDEQRMLGIAAEIGFAETAFLSRDDAGYTVRYFSPIAEVPFCGHATVATAVAVATTAGDATFTFRTPVGPVEISTSSDPDGRRAAFTSVDPETRDLAEPVLRSLLDLVGLTEHDLDSRHPPRLVYAGNWHPLLVVRDRAVFDAFSFDPALARTLLDRPVWPATIIVLHDTGGGLWEARNIFPVGTITEDPATGAAAAATGGYLRATGAVQVPARIHIAQGRHVGRPSTLTVDIPEAGGITVSGGAVRIG